MAVTNDFRCQEQSCRESLSWKLSICTSIERPPWGESLTRLNHRHESRRPWMFISKQRLVSDRKSNHKQPQQGKVLFLTRFTCARMFSSGSRSCQRILAFPTGLFITLEIIDVRRNKDGSLFSSAPSSRQRVMDAKLCFRDGKTFETLLRLVGQQ